MTIASRCSSAARISSPRRAGGGHSGKHEQVVYYRHVIHSLQRKPMALLNLPGSAIPPKSLPANLRSPSAGQSGKRLAGPLSLLALAHERGCEPELAEQLAAGLRRAIARYRTAARSLRS